MNKAIRQSTTAELIGTRWVYSPLHVPTGEGYLGCRRGTVVGVGPTLHADLPCRTATLRIHLDDQKGSGTKGVKNAPLEWLIREEKFERWVNEAGGVDPYASSPPDYSCWCPFTGYIGPPPK